MLTWKNLVMLLALCCFVGCNNPANSGGNDGDETTDWWIGTWKSQVYQTTLPSNEEINFYYLFEIKYNSDYKSDEQGTFVYSIIDNDSDIIYNDDATVSTIGYTCEGTWSFIKDHDDIGDSIYLIKNDGDRLFEGGLRLDYDKQQLFIYDWETSLHEYCTKIE